MISGKAEGQDMTMAPRVHGFAELKRLLDELPNQVIGFPSAVCETGEQYIEFHEFALARPNDVATIERIVSDKMAVRLWEYLDARGGRIYWRQPFESEIREYSTIVRFDENGPDYDALTDRKCVMDRNWRRVACYCRFYRASRNVEFTPRPILKAVAS